MRKTTVLIVSFLVIGPWARATSVVASTVPPVKSNAIADLKEQVRRNPKDLTLTVKLAQAEHQAGDDASAATLLWGQVERLDRAGILLLISIHKNLKEWANVAKATNFILSKNPKDAEALTALGQAQFMLAKKPDDAKETLRKAIEADPHYRPAYDVLAAMYEKNPYEERLLYQDMVEAFGPQADLLTRLCALNTNDGENEQGETYCKKAIAADDSLPDNHVNMGVIAVQKGDLEKAKKYLKSAADRFAKSEFAQYQEGAFLESQKNWVTANKYYEACMKADPLSERCAVGVGNTAVQLRKFDRAIEAYRIACRKNGRKIVATIRRAASGLRKDGGPSDRFEELADNCQRQ